MFRGSKRHRRRSAVGEQKIIDKYNIKRVANNIEAPTGLSALRKTKLMNHPPDVTAASTVGAGCVLAECATGT